MKGASLAALAALVCGCSTTVDVTRVVTPREAVGLRPTKLVPVAIARGDERVPLPDGAIVGPTSVRVKGGGGRKLQPGDALEVDEQGAISAVRSAGGEWTDFDPKVVLADGSVELGGGSPDGEKIRLARGDRIVMRGTLQAGDSLPDGAHVEIKRRSGFLVFGVLSLVIGYVPVAIAGAASKGETPPNVAVANADIDRPALVPIFGPWIAMANRLQNPCIPSPYLSGVDCAGPSAAIFGYAFSGVTQGIGLIFLLAGLPSYAELVEPAEPDPDEKEKAKTTVRLVPLTFPNGAGLGVGGRF